MGSSPRNSLRQNSTQKSTKKCYRNVVDLGANNDFPKNSWKIIFLGRVPPAGYLTFTILFFRCFLPNQAVMATSNWAPEEFIQEKGSPLTTQMINTGKNPNTVRIRKIRLQWTPLIVDIFIQYWTTAMNHAIQSFTTWLAALEKKGLCSCIVKFNARFRGVHLNRRPLY